MNRMLFTTIFIGCLATRVLAADAQTNNPPASIRKPADPNKPPAKWIGVSLGRVDDAIRVHLPRFFNGMPDGAGLVVRDVMPESPALAAGLEKNDIVLRADGEPLTDIKKLIEVVSRHNAATSVKLDIIHAGQPKTVYCLVLERPAENTRMLAREQAKEEKWRDFWTNAPTTVTYTDAEGKQQTIVIEQVGDLLRRLREDDKLFETLRKTGVEFHTVVPPLGAPPAGKKP